MAERFDRAAIVAGASSGFGAMSARARAKAGHVVYASMRDPAAGGGAAAKMMVDFAKPASTSVSSLSTSPAVLRLNALWRRSWPRPAGPPSWPL